MIQTALSQQPGCVVDPSYVMYASVFGISDRNEICLIGVEEPVKYTKTRNYCEKCRHWLTGCDAYPNTCVQGRETMDVTY